MTSLTSCSVSPTISVSSSDSSSIEFIDWGYKYALRQNFAFRHLNLKISAGERVMILGASGLGKSTILHAIAGLLGGSHTGDGSSIDEDGGLTEGRVLIDGISASQAVGHCGFVLQDPEAQTIFDRLADNVAFAPENLGVERSEIDERVEASLEAVGLGNLQWHRSTAHLSGGQAQRLALASVLSMQPDVLVLDEPTSNIDPEGVQQLVDAVTDVVTQQNSTLVMVEHRADAWLNLINRVIVFNTAAGVRDTTDSPIDSTIIVADGKPDDVFNRADIDWDELGIWVPQKYRKPKLTPDINTVGDANDFLTGVESPVLLTAHNLAIGRGQAAIASGIDFTAKSGETIALIGQNGTGKSTLSMTFAGLLSPVSGEVTASRQLQGAAQSSHPIEWTSPELASRIQYVFQNPEHQFATASVLQEVELSLKNVGLDEDAEHGDRLAHDILREYGLDEFASANPYTLSGGQKRRLTVACALAAQPKVLILDEPTFGQDRTTWQAIVNTINARASEGMCIIVVTHDIELIEAIGARTVILSETMNMEAVGTKSVETKAADMGANNQEPEDKVSIKTAYNKTHITVVPTSERTEKPRSKSPSAIIAGINPVFRLLAALLVCIVMLLSLDIVSSIVEFIAVFVSFVALGFTPWKIFKVTWPVWVGSIGSSVAVALYGNQAGTSYVEWGVVHITQGSLELACATALRIIAMGIPAILLIYGVDPTDLADSFSQQLKLSDRFVYGGLAGMRLFPVLQDDWAALAASRRSRGIGFDKNKSVKAFAQQSFALLVLSIRRSSALAVAMQARGFGADIKRTHWRISTVKAQDYVFTAIAVLVPVIALVVAALAGTFSFLGTELHVL